MQADFTASLLREKLVFAKDGRDGDEAYVAVFQADDEKQEVVTDSPSPDVLTVRSNRIVLQAGKSATSAKPDETIVVRAQTSYIALLLASRALALYFKDGSFSGRDKPYDWDKQWGAILSNYEKKYNADTWAIIYVDGKAVFRTREDPVLDMIEKFAAGDPDRYDRALTQTAATLATIDPARTLSQNMMTAATFHGRDGIMTCGFIDRVNKQAHHMTIAGSDDGRRIVQGMVTAAAFLEALNLGFIAAGLQNKIWMQEVAQASPEGFRLHGAMVRLVALNKWIDGFEKKYDVAYRPDKPKLFINE